MQNDPYEEPVTQARAKAIKTTYMIMSERVKREPELQDNKEFMVSLEFARKRAHTVQEMPNA